jgi:hypothetical protein
MPPAVLFRSHGYPKNKKPPRRPISPTGVASDGQCFSGLCRCSDGGQQLASIGINAVILALPLANVADRCAHLAPKNVPRTGTFVHVHNSEQIGTGVQPHIIEAVLNHVSGHKAGVAGVYNRSTYENEKRDALDALSNYVMVAVAKADSGNVQRLKRA